MKFLSTALLALLHMTEVHAFTMPAKPAFTRVPSEIKAVRDYVSQDQVYGASPMGAYNPYQQPQSNVQLALDKLNNVLQHGNRHGTVDNAKARLENVLSQAMESSGAAANEQDFNMLNSVVDSTLQRMNELEILGLMEKLKGDDYGVSTGSGGVTTNDYTMMGKNNQYDAWHHTSEDASASSFSSGGLWSDSLARTQEYRQNTLDPSMNQFSQMNQNNGGMAGGMAGGMDWSSNLAPSFSQKESFSKYNQDFAAGNGNDWWKKQPSTAEQPNAGGNFMSSEGSDQFSRWYHPGGQSKKKEEPKKATFQPRSTGSAMGMNQNVGPIPNMAMGAGMNQQMMNSAPMPNMAMGAGMNQQMMNGAPMNPEAQNTFVVAKRNSPASSYYNYGGYDNYYSPNYYGNNYRSGNWWEHGAERNRKMDYGFGYGNGVSRYGGYGNNYYDSYYGGYGNGYNSNYGYGGYGNNYYDNGYGGYGNGYYNNYYNSYSPYSYNSYYDNGYGGYGNGYYNNYDNYGYGGYGNGYYNNRYSDNWYNGNNGYYNGNSYYNSYSMSPYGSSYGGYGNGYNSYGYGDNWNNRYYNDYSYYGNYNDYYSPYSYNNYYNSGYGNGYYNNGYGGYGNGYYNNNYNNGYGGYGNGYYNNYNNNDWYNGYDSSSYYNNNYGGYGNGYYGNYGYGGYGGYGNGYYNSYSPYSYNSYSPYSYNSYSPYSYNSYSPYSYNSYSPYSYNSYGYGTGYYGGYGDDWYNGNGYYNNNYGNSYYGNSWYGDSDWYGGSYDRGIYSRSGYFLGEPKVTSWNNMKERKMRSKGEEYSYRNRDRQMAYY